jgi:hypothetical protein
LIVLSGCEKPTGTIGLGEQANDGKAISVTDTFTLKTSTVLLDSLPTSGTGTLLLGRVNDPRLGFIESSSFFHLGAPGTYSEMPASAMFDSVTVKLAYSGYHYGDTTQTIGVDVHQLTDVLELIENKKFDDPDESSLLSSYSALYNNSVVGFDNSVLGKIRFKPKPGSDDTLSVKLADGIGRNLFTLAKNNDPLLTNEEDFKDYFKGIALLPDRNSGNSIVGFKTSGACLQLHYSELSMGGIRHPKILKFNLTDSLLQYNRITADRSNTALRDLTLQNKEISSVETSNENFVQAGVGLATKIQFPGIFSFLYDRTVVINKAELIIEVPANNSKPFTPPQNVILFIANKKGKPQSILKSFGSDGDQVAAIEKEEITGASRYVFNLNDYLSYLRKTNDLEVCLLLSVAHDKLNNSMERLVTGAPGNLKAKIKLNIIYTQYDN